MRPTAVAAIVAALAGTAAAVAETPARVILSTIATDPTSQVPGGPATQRFRGFGRPGSSSDGSRWVLIGSSTTTASQDLLLLGNGSAVSTALKLGDTAPWDATETVGRFDRPVGINNAGQFAFSAATSAAATSNEVLVRGGPGPTFTVVHRKGDGSVPGVPGAFFDTFDGAGITDAGTVYHNAELTGAVTQDDDTANFLGDTLLARTGVMAPGGQPEDPPVPYKFIRDPLVSAAGDTWALNADIAAADTTQDSVIVVDGQIVVREGFPLPNSEFAEAASVNSTGLGVLSMAPNGDWFLRGLNGVAATGTQWVARNGQVVAQRGQPIFPGSSESWARRPSTSGVFFYAFGNNDGDYVVGGATDIGADVGNELLSGVLVLNNRRVILRSNEAVDVNGDGVPEPDAFIQQFVLDTAFLTPDRKLYIVVRLKSQPIVTTVSSGTALLVKNVCFADFDGQNGVQVADIFAFLSAWFNQLPSANFDSTPAIDVADIFAFLSEWFAGC